MGDRTNNMGKMMNNPKQRNIVIALGAIAVVTIGSGVYVASKGSGPKPVVGAAVISVPQVSTIPGSSDNPQYNKNIKEANDKAVVEALAKDKSYVPVILNDKSISDKSIIDQIDRDKKIKEASQKELSDKIQAEATSKAAAEQLAVTQPTAVPLQAAQVVQVTPPVKYLKYNYGDASVIDSLLSINKIKTPSSEYDFARQAPTKDNTANVQATSTSQAAAQLNTTDGSDNVTTLAKAGTIFNAILETGINSDEPSPVLAKIISGDLKGTKLIGQIQTVGEKVIVQFSTANVPQLGNSVALTAYAVNPNTSRTALADDVNHHYFLKYGVMLASSFLSGFSDIISRKNSTTTVSPFGGATVTEGNLSNRDINKAALGSVGKAIATEGQQFQSIKPTIVVNSGSAIGILLIDDFKVKN